MFVAIGRKPRWAMQKVPSCEVDVGPAYFENSGPSIAFFDTLRL
jgi:hypothetical protein